MPRLRATALVLTALLVSGVVVGCTAPKDMAPQWPAATFERAVPRPVGPSRWPLTGLPAPSADAVTVRVVSVKIENSPQARPQTGLDKADIVYETVTEGGITRFNALFQSQTPPSVGPVRSARPSDLSIVPQYRALFAHVGGDAAVRTELQNRTLYDDMDQFSNPGPYTRDKSRPAPHNMYLSISKLRAAAIVSRGYEATATITGPTFAATVAPPVPSVSAITVPFSAANTVTWTYDPSTLTYSRSIGGKAQTDRATRKAYTARNVVVLWAIVRPYTPAGPRSQVLDIQLTGSGRMTVFRDGQRFDGSWSASTTTVPVLRDGNGRIVPLAPGNTWFQVIANDQNIAMR